MLVATKFIPPTSLARAFPRERLFSFLANRPGKRLSAVIAPAGYGKTTLVTQWLQQQTAPWCWLSLDESDNAPGRFWRYFIGAIEAQGQLKLPKSADLVTAAAPMNPETFIATLMNEITQQHATYQPQLHLVLDDFHHIHDPQICQLLTYFIDYAPPDLHLILTSRVEPPLPFYRWKVKGFLDAAYSADIAFNEAESMRFVGETLGIRISGDVLDRLWARTEGWAAALQLEAIKLQQTETDPSPIKKQSLREATQESRFLHDYIMIEILGLHSEAIHAFVLDAACLPRLSAQLADEVLQRNDSREMIDELERLSLFLIPLDTRNEWYRFHELFREALLKHQQEKHPERFRHIQVTAGKWLLEHGQAAEGVDLLVTHKDWNALAQGLERVGNRLIQEGHPLLIEYALDHLPPPLVDASLRLQMVRIWALFFLNRLENLRPLIIRLEDQLDRFVAEDHPDSALAPALSSEAAIVRSYIARALSDRKGAIRLSSRALQDAETFDIPLKSVIYYGIALDQYADGNLPEAKQTLFQSIEHGKAELKFPTILSSAGLLAWIQYHQGDIDSALDNVNNAVEWVKRHHDNPAQPRLISCWMNVALVEIFREQNELDIAEGYLRPLLKHLKQGLEPGQHVLIQYVRANLAIANAQYDEALQYLEDAERVLVQKRDVIMFEPPGIDALRARCHLAMGETKKAIAWMHRWSPDDCQSPLNREQGAITVARVFIQQGDYARALSSLSLIRDACELTGHRKHLMETLVAMAVVLFHVGQGEMAKKRLGEALTLAQSNRFVAVFDEEPTAILSLLSAMDVPDVPSAFIDDIRRLLNRPRPMLNTPEVHGEVRPPSLHAVAERAEKPVSPLVEPLSQRELEVLELINAGLSNKDIASKLFLAPATVKAHIRNLYAKIDAVSRTDALAKARQLHLIKM